jgi:hypothetical protein
VNVHWFQSQLQTNRLSADNGDILKLVAKRRENGYNIYNGCDGSEVAFSNRVRLTFISQNNVVGH